MRSVIFSMAIVLAGCRADPGSSAPSARDEVLAVLRAQEAAWNRGDLEGFMEGYLDSEEITFFSGPNVLRGHAALRERYRARYASEGTSAMGALAFEDLHAEPVGPASAVAKGRWRLRRKKDGAEEELEGLFTLILRKTPSGWRIVHDHTSS